MFIFWILVPKIHISIIETHFFIAERDRDRERGPFSHYSLPDLQQSQIKSQNMGIQKFFSFWVISLYAPTS